MKKKKLLFSIGAIALTLALTTAAMLYGMDLHTASLASGNIAEEIEKVSSANELLKTRRDILKDDVGSKTDDTEHKDALNKQIAEITGNITTMKSDIEDAEKNTKALKAETDAVRETLTVLTNGMNLTRGKSISVESEVICPFDIEEGRYIASGDGIITIIANSGSARVSEDLLNIDTGTYTFDLAYGEVVRKTEGSITLTELK